MEPEGTRPTRKGEGVGLRRGGDTAREGGGQAHESRGPLPTREGGRCPREKGAVAHERRGPSPAKRGSVAHEERGLSSRRGGGLGRRRVGGSRRREGTVYTGKKGQAREDGVRAAGEMARCEGEGHPARIGECTRVVTERLRFPAPNIPPQRVLSAGSYPGRNSARLRPKREAYADVPRSSRRSRGHGRFHANSTEGSLRS